MDSSSSSISFPKPYLAAIFIRFVYAGLFIIAKCALNKGMSHSVFAVYRLATAALVFAPLALVFERDQRRPGRPIILRIFFLGLSVVFDQNLYYAGMNHTTATFATSIINFLPVVSFLFAFLFRRERVELGKLHGKAKVLGTLVSVGGVLVMTFFKGLVIRLPWTKLYDPTGRPVANYHHHNSIGGPLMILGSCVFAASFNILQEDTLKQFKAPLSLTAMVNAVGAVQGLIAGVVLEKGIHASTWSIHWDVMLLAYVYGGIMCSGVAFYFSGVVIKEKGVVFLTSFNPLTTVVVAGCCTLLLAEQLYLGKVIGAVVIVVGVYLVLWGKSKDDKYESSTVHIVMITYPCIDVDGSKETTTDDVV